MSNPNPQPPGTSQRYKSIRDMKALDPDQGMIKFSKRASLLQKPTSQQVIEAHLKHIGQSKLIEKKSIETKKREEQKFL